MNISIDTYRRAAFLVALLMASTALAQQSSPPAKPGGGAIRLDVVVTPGSGPPVSDLQQHDFTILDNKVPQAITSFQAISQREDPLDVILVVDAVNADYSTVAFERDQIDEFLRADGGELSHPLSLSVLTDTGLRNLEDFSRDGNKLSASLDGYTVSLHSITHSSGVYGASERFALSLQALHDLVQREAPRPGRKIMIWVSPGWPLFSAPMVVLSSKEQQQLFADIVGMSMDLWKSRVTLYSIDPVGTGGNVIRASYWQSFLKGVSKPNQVVPGNLSLQVLATQSGGVAFYINNNITALLQSCLADARAYYEISFDPPAGGGAIEYHHLEVQVAKHGLTARSRQGYYSLPAL